MLRTIWLVSIATTIVSLTTFPAVAKKRAKPAQANSATIECFKQYGASIDPVTKQLTLYATERDGMSRLDAVRACISSKSGGPRNNIRIPERVPNAGSG
jgi:hypothetical protein